MLRRKANHAFHRAYKTSTKENWDKYKEARRAFKRTLRKSKRESRQDFCRKTEPVHESARLHRLLSKTHVNELGMLRLPYGGWTKSLEEANEHLMDVHFPGCCIDKTIKKISMLALHSRLNTGGSHLLTGTSLQTLSPVSELNGLLTVCHHSNLQEKMRFSLLSCKKVLYTYQIQ